MKIFSLFLMLLVVSCNNSTVNTMPSNRGSGVVDIIDTNGSKILSYSGSYALVIGQSDYEHWGDLNSIPSELDQVESVLEDQGFVVKRYANLNSKNLKRTFEKFINNYGLDKNNRLLFFYSGHGESRLNGRKGYIVPVDAPNLADEKGFLAKAVAMNQVMTWARDIEAKHALFLFDSCFSGTLFGARNIPKIPRQITDAMAEPVRQFITAGRANETVPAKSTFTPAFVDALRYAYADTDKDGYITGMELGIYLWNKVPKHIRQTPQYGKIKDFDLSVGDFVFKVKNKSKPVINTQPSDFTKEVITFGQAKGLFFVPLMRTNLEGYHPVWSSDGKAIVYLTNSLSENKGTDMFISTNLGHSSQLVTTIASKAYFPRFSPDNRFISVITDLNPFSHRGYVKGHLKLYDTNTGTMRAVTSQRQRIVFSMNYQVNYDWNPKQNKVAFIAADVDSDEQYLAVYDIKTSIIQKYSAKNQHWFPQWSSNGKRVGFVTGDGGSYVPHIVDLETNRIISISEVEIQSYFQWITNTKIIFTAGGSGEYRIATYNIDNQKLGYMSKYDYYNSPVLSNNRKFVVYYNTVQETNDFHRHDLYMQDLETMKTTKICELSRNPFYMDLFVQISPDEKKQAVFSYHNNILIFKIELNNKVAQ